MFCLILSIIYLHSKYSHTSSLEITGITQINPDQSCSWNRYTNQWKIIKNQMFLWKYHWIILYPFLDAILLPIIQRNWVDGPSYHRTWWHGLYRVIFNCFIHVIDRELMSFFVFWSNVPPLEITCITPIFGILFGQHLSICIGLFQLLKLK